MQAGRRVRLAGRSGRWQADPVTPVTTARGAQPKPGPDRPSGPAWSPLKALVVLILAVALGVYLIALGSGHHAPASAATSGTTTRSGTQSTPPSSTVPPSSTTTTTTTTTPSGAQPSPTVKILVANASQTNGVAGYYSQKLSAAGWGALTPVTATTAESSSSVYYATGRKGDGLAVAAALGIATSAVQPLGSTRAPVVGATQAQIVVVVGDDLAARAPAGSG